MKRASIFLVLLAAAAFAARPQAQAKPAAGGRLIEIQASEQMKYSVTAITAKPGELLHVRLTALGTMPKAAMSHNFVLLKAGTDAQAFANDAMMAASTGYIPAAKKADVLASTPHMVGGGETADVTFKAPQKAGTYTYLCTFPGHFAAGMRGTLTVK